MSLRKNVRSAIDAVVRRHRKTKPKAPQVPVKAVNIAPPGFVRLTKGKPFVGSLQGRTLVIERIEVSVTPIIHVVGWYDADTAPDLRIITKAGASHEPHGLYRGTRPDVVSSGACAHAYCGFVAEFYLRDVDHLCCGEIKIEIPQRDRVGTVTPHYGTIFETSEVLHREHIYGHGQPVDVSDEIVELCATLKGTILDFGCGNGDLVRRLRLLGYDAHGIELASDRVDGKIKPEVLDYVRMYDGRFPMPYEDGAFDYVIATEVVEHIPEPERLPAEFARLARTGIFLTVPDITSIPAGFEHGVVPWHLLEATHVNFFTAKSLTRLFEPFFVPEVLYRIGTRRINGRMLAGSVVVRFGRR